MAKAEPEAVTSEHTCAWCKEPFTTRKGGKPQQFCKEDCRNAFHRACRIWAEEQFWSGELPVSLLKQTLSQRIRFSEGG